MNKDKNPSVFMFGGRADIQNMEGKNVAKQSKTNFTQIPNQVLDTMSFRTPAENLVLFAVCRKTYGWQKTRDRISLTQIMALTGISKQGVLNCLKSLKLNMWIESDKDDYGNIFYMALEKDETELALPRIEPEKWKKISDRSKPSGSGRKTSQTIRLVKSVDRSNHLTAASQTNGQGQSNQLTDSGQTIGHTKENLNILSKEKEKEKDSSPSSAILDSIPEETQVPSQSKADAFIAEYKRLYTAKERIELLDRYLFTIQEIGQIISYDLSRLGNLFENYKRSWWTVEKKMRATPDNMLKFLNQNSDSDKSEFKGQEKSRYKDENGNYTNQDGASEWYKKDWERMRAEAEKAHGGIMTPEDLALADQF